jgi:hypothetical protein
MVYNTVMVQNSTLDNKDIHKGTAWFTSHEVRKTSGTYSCHLWQISRDG